MVNLSHISKKESCIVATRGKTFHLRFDNRRNMESAVYSPTKDVDGLTSKTFIWGTSSMTTGASGWAALVQCHGTVIPSY